jgi:hypothetical protein
LRVYFGGHKLKRIITVAIAFLILGLSGGAQADFIDFRGNYFNSADNDPFFKYEPAGLTITPGPSGATLYWDNKDGFGVRSSNGYEYDEIDGKEILHLSFNTPQLLNKILVTDLFVEPYSNGNGSYLETGYYSFNNESWTLFYAESSQTLEETNGVLSLTLPSLKITDIWFMAPGKIYLDGDTVKTNHEFSVAGIDVTPAPVPEPATMLLLGSGLAGMFGLRRKLKK